MRQFMKQMKEDGVEDIGSAGKLALAKFQEKSDPKRSTWLQHRRNAIRAMAGKNRAAPPAETVMMEKELLKQDKPLEMKAAQKHCAHFQTKQYAVNESIGTLEVRIVRTGSLDTPVRFQVKTRDGTAICEPGENQDYEKIDQLIEFASGIDVVTVPVKIIDDDTFEPDEDFYLDLQDPDTFETLETCKIEIIDDDAPGIISFEFTNYTFVESQKYMKGNIIRRNGASGKATVELVAFEDTAKNDVNFVIPEEPTIITFDHMAIKKEFCFPLIDTNFDGKMNVSFKLKLQNPTGGASLSAMKLSTVTISNDADLMVKLDKLQAIMESRAKMLDPSTSSWTAQFQDALVIKGEIDEITGEETLPSAMAYTMHFLSIGWKVLFALVPPTDYYGGWAAFCVAVTMIGALTAVIGEIATMFGCSLGISPGVTAITFVALGTSLPDTFASGQAALSEDYADSAIGNVTGSNAVNVFLGLGLPWLLSSIYWAINGKSDECTDDTDDCSGKDGYYLPAEGLSFSVVIFVSFALTAIVTMVLRHFYCDGVLGGKPQFKKPTAVLFAGMWMIYIVLASLKIEGKL